MISQVSDYKYVNGDLNRIIIDGNIIKYRQGTSQNILRGEDVTFLLEGLGERKLAIDPDSMIDNRYSVLTIDKINFSRVLGANKSDIEWYSSPHSESNSGMMRNDLALGIIENADRYDSQTGSLVCASYGDALGSSRIPTTTPFALTILKKSDIISAFDNLRALTRAYRQEHDVANIYPSRSSAGTFSSASSSSSVQIIDGRSVTPYDETISNVGSYEWRGENEFGDCLYEWLDEGGTGVYDGVRPTWGWWYYQEVNPMMNNTNFGMWINNVPPGATVTPVLQFKIKQIAVDQNSNGGGARLNRSVEHYGYVHLPGISTVSGSRAMNDVGWNWSQIHSQLNFSSFSYYLSRNLLSVTTAPLASSYRNPSSSGYASRYTKRYMSMIWVKPWGAVIDLGDHTKWWN